LVLVSWLGGYFGTARHDPEHEVRKRLEHYYVSEETKDQIGIHLPTGSYIPTFCAAGVATAPESACPQPPLKGPEGFIAGSKSWIRL
jgi:hypothetical protein